MSRPLANRSVLDADGGKPWVTHPSRHAVIDFGVAAERPGDRAVGANASKVSRDARARRRPSSC
jgi:hypothetical protein